MASDHSDRLLTPAELAAYLEVPVTTVYSWRYRHEGPAGFRVGRHVRFRWRDIEDWIETQMSSERRILGR